MDAAHLIERRLQSHRLTAPARTVAEAGAHMLAVQGQEFWGARWALAARTKGSPTLRDVDAAFDRGDLLRAWTMRGTLHVIPARDLRWVLSLTGERMLRSAAARHRQLGLDADDFARAERTLRAALQGVNALTRAEAFDVLGAGGVDPAGQRGYHVLFALAARAVLCWGPVVAREGTPSREQRLVLVDEWVRDAAQPADPLAEFYLRYLAAHGPAGPADFAWWSGLPLGTARAAADAASDRIDVLGEDLHVVAGAGPRRSATAEVMALPPFEEYYLSYADRSGVAAPEFLTSIGPGSNGMVRAVILARGRIVGVWSHSVAVGKHTRRPLPELFDPTGVSDVEVAAALDRYAAFITG